MSVNAIAKRDGTTCRICNAPVDMNARRPNRSGPSVDHIVPIALGGTNDPENLQLAHDRCNSIKGKRLGWVIATT